MENVELVSITPNAMELLKRLREEDQKGHVVPQRELQPGTRIIVPCQQAER